MNENYLNDTEKTLIASFNANVKMVEAVKKVLLTTVYHQGTAKADEPMTDVNWAFSIVNGESKSNERIGEEVRARVAALGFIQSGFERLTEIKEEEKRPKKCNPAL